MLFPLLTDQSAANHAHEAMLTLSPTTSEVVLNINDSHIAICIGHNVTQLKWSDPNGKVVTDKKGRIHVEEMGTGNCSKYVCTYI